MLLCARHNVRGCVTSIQYWAHLWPGQFQSGEHCSAACSDICSQSNDTEQQVGEHHYKTVVTGQTNRHQREHSRKTIGAINQRGQCGEWAVARSTLLHNPEGDQTCLHSNP